MPDQILYCDRCARLISPADRSGTLIHGDNVLCPTCRSSVSDDALAAYTAADDPSASGAGHRMRPSERRRGSGRSRARTTTGHAHPRVTSLSRGRMTIVVSVAGALLGFAIALVVASRRGGPPEAAAQPETPTPPQFVPPAPAVSPPVVTPAAVKTVAPPPPEASTLSPEAQARFETVAAIAADGLSQYTKARAALVDFIEKHGGSPEGERARTMLEKLDALYAERASEALEIVSLSAEGARDMAGLDRAISSARTIATRFGEGPWLERAGNAKIEAVVTRIEAMRAEIHKLDDPGYGIPRERDVLYRHVEDADEYQLVYDINLGKLGNPIRYHTDNSATHDRAFDRIAYLVELFDDPKGDPRYVFVSMKAFTSELSKIGIPTAASGASFQCPVEDLAVASNVDGVTTGTGLAGNLEFWPNNYGGGNGRGIEGASPGTFDFGDDMGQPLDGYGSMQVHVPSERLTLFAINNWKAGRGADIGIGNNPNGNPDWTFSHAAARYPRMRLRVFVK